MNAFGKIGRAAALTAALVVGGAGLYGLGVTGPATVEAGEKEGKEHHPHIHKALHELREARSELKEANHDFGGHRKEALEAVDHAIVQLEKALKHDKK